jgi:proteasome lid subunit RPN8/RPN11
MTNFRTKARTGTPSLLVRPHPAEDGDFVAFHAMGDGFRAYVHQDVLAYVERETRKAAPDEAIGLLAGRTCHDPAYGPYTLVMAADGARAEEVDAGPSHVHISAFGHASVRQRLEALHPDREIVGWYHSHPHFAAEFSHIDRAEQSTWANPNHVGIVVSGSEKNEPFGVYRGPGADRLLSRNDDRRSRADVRSGFITGNVLPGAVHTEQVATERAAPGRSKFPGVAILPTGREPGIPRFQLGRRINSKPRLAAVLTVVGLLMGIIWLHVRVRAIETALSGSRGFASISNANPFLVEARSIAPSTPPHEPRVMIEPEISKALGNRTELTDNLASGPAENPLKQKSTRKKPRRVAKDKKPDTRAKNNKPVEAKNPGPTETRSN